jgi:VWFA-related protein
MTGRFSDFFRLKPEATEWLKARGFRPQTGFAFLSRRFRGFRLQAEVAALVAVLAAGSSVLLRGQAPQEPTPTFRQGVEAVQLSVIVTDNEGNPVSGLTADDFEILENKVVRPITTFAAVDIPIERTERVAAASDVQSNDGPPGRLYVFALDLMAPDNALRTRHFLRQFVEQYFGPHDTAAVVITTGSARESGQEFTSDPRILLKAIDKFDGGASIPEIREKNFIGDFRDLMRVISTLRGGRKAVIFVSGRIPVDALDAVDKARNGLGGRIFSNVDVDPNWVEALSLATRNNIAVYPVDPGGLTTETTAPGSFDTSALEGRMSLGGLAEVTGGFALSGSNNYAGAFERLVRENSTYYLIAFESGIEQRDGRYVRLDVRVKRPGLQVRSTEGYFMPRGRQQQDTARRPSTVLAATWDAVSSAITTSGVSMRVNATAFKGRGKDAIVPITLEIAPEKLNLVEENGAYRGVLEVVFATTDSKKRKFPIWRHRAAFALRPETYERVRKGGAIRVISQIPLPDGRFQIRASAGGAAVAGSVVYDLDVPNFRDDFALSGVSLTSTQARETFTFSPHKQIDVGLPGPPTTAREFSRDDTLTLFAEAYENRKKPHTVTLAYELRSLAGLVIAASTMERKSVEKPKDSSVYPFAPDLSLENVAPGRYTIHIEARSSLDKNRSVTRDIPFSVR